MNHNVYKNIIIYYGKEFENAKFVEFYEEKGFLGV